MGGAPSMKPETNAERNARLLAGKKSSKDIAALNAADAYLRRSRRRNPLFGGPESGTAAQPLGGGMGGVTKLGVA